LRQFRLAADDARFPVGALEGLDYPFFRNWHKAEETAHDTEPQLFALLPNPPSSLEARIGLR
jgi:hypothetical protein